MVGKVGFSMHKQNRKWCPKHWVVQRLSQTLDFFMLKMAGPKNTNATKCIIQVRQKIQALHLMQNSQ